MLDSFTPNVENSATHVLKSKKESINIRNTERNMDLHNNTTKNKQDRSILIVYLGMGQNLVPLLFTPSHSWDLWMFIPLKMVFS